MQPHPLLAFTAAIIWVSSSPMLAVDPPPPPRFEIGSLTAPPGQTGLSLPLSMVFTEGNSNGWAVVVRTDPAAVVISGVELTRHADYVQFNPQDAYHDPGTIGFSAIYTMLGGEPDMLPAAASGTVAHLRVCVSPTAPAGAHPVTILAEAEPANASSGTNRRTSYSLFVEGPSFGGTPVIGPPGVLTVKGTPVSQDDCDVPSLPEGPKIRFHVDAPAAVSAGASFTAAVQVTTDTALVGLSLALDMDEAALVPTALTPATTWDAHSPYMLFSLSAADGTVGFSVISDMLEWQSRILPGTHTLAELQVQVLPTAAEGATTIGFADRVEHDTFDPEHGNPIRVGYENQATINGKPAEPDPQPRAVTVRSLAGVAVAIVRETAFIRGDTDGNAVVDLADAVAVLEHLFSGQPAPACQDAADVDDSGIIDITDSISLLGFLFLGHAELPPPGPYVHGPDPTTDDLPCYG
jgi:hypothetical protein